ncbi:MAG: prephenate dehydratase, partial [Candidatus Electrothrix sp. AR3]|nr:prephenate dehydratase [Candidatus Electrothrix sp. AR3]
MNEEKSIPQVRQRIDAIDDTILNLLKERLDCALSIGRLKEQTARSTWDPRREREIYARLFADNGKLFPEKALRSIFHEIITTCRLAQQKTEVAFLGPEATFTHLAGIKYFGYSAEYKALESIDEVFHEVEKGRVEYGIVPVENSIEGAVFSTLDSFMKYRVKICGELHLPIRHNLVCQSGDIKDIQTVASHYQPLAQCREWLRKNLADMPTLEVFSTAGAAQMAANNPNIGAIASELAVKTYNVQIAVSGIEDYQGNTTRFLVIGNQSPTPSGHDKTSLLLGMSDQPGALNQALTILSDKKINLAKIESRPIKGKKWKYLFFLDLIGHRDDPVVAEGCAALKQSCAYYEWLGSYPVCDRQLNMANLLSCRELSKAFGAQTLFSAVNLVVAKGDRIGLIGPNGSGKSTLLKILAGLVEADNGELFQQKHVRISYLAQEDSFDEEKSCADNLYAAVSALHLEPVEQYNRVHTLLSRAEFVDPEISVHLLSGGWRKRLAICRALVVHPDVLVMDEPTNHLDIEGILWLEKLLQASLPESPDAYLMVSHDRRFLENTVGRIIELSAAYPEGTFQVNGNYSAFLDKRQIFLEQQQDQEERLANKVRREKEWLSRGPKARATKAKYRKDEAYRLQDELADIKSRNRVGTKVDISFDA